MEADRNFETVIVGGGLAGLICGAYLAREGREVTVFESGSQPGGRAQTAVDDDEFHFNLGPHALYDSDALAESLDALEIDYSGGPPDGEMFGLHGEAVEALPEGPLSLFNTDLLGAVSKFKFFSFMWKLQTAKPSDLPAGMSAADWLQTEVPDADLRAVAEAFARLATYAADLQRMPAGIMLDALSSALDGVTYVDGGWQHIVDQLARILRQAGGELETETPVQRVEWKGPEEATVHLRGGPAVTARNVVLAVPPKQARGLVGSALAEKAGIPAEPTPVHASCLDLAFRKLPHPRRSLALGIDRPIYISDHGPFADLAPDDGTVVHAAKYLETGESTGSDELRGEIESALDTFQPGWRKHLVNQRFLSRMTVVSHMPDAEKRGYESRPQADVSDVDGLYLAGDWVGSRGWLSNASAASATAVARAICSDLAE